MRSRFRGGVVSVLIASAAAAALPSTLVGLPRLPNNASNKRRAVTLTETKRNAASPLPPRIEWAEGYSFAPYESHPHAGVQTDDGGFLMVGDGVDYTHSDPSIARLWFVAKVTAKGVLEWQSRLGDVGFNYGKFGVQLPDGSFAVVGALSVDTPPYGPVLHRAVVRLSPNGTEMGRLVIPNLAPAIHLRDGYMGIALGDDPTRSFVVVGFAGGENATAPGYVDEPMFLIKRGRAVVARVAYGGSNGPLTLMGEATITPPPRFGGDIYQAMRVVWDRANGQYAVSHTVSLDGGGNIQMGLTAVSPDGAVRWTRVFPAAVPESPRLAGHASHPYALTLAAGPGGGYGLGGLAVLYDLAGIERCQGRLLRVSPAGDIVWDSRFNSSQKDTNIECYGVAAATDGGFAMVCGTGVEPELHPGDSQRLKTWMVLFIRTDAAGAIQYQQTLTDNAELKSNAGEYIVARRDGGYAVYVDSKGTYGPGQTGGNFALMALAPDASPPR